MGRGRDAEAVDVIHKVAAYNERRSNLTLELLQEAGTTVGRDIDVALDTSAKAAALRKLRKFDMDHVKGLFATRKLGYSTTLLIILWGAFSIVLLSSEAVD